MFKFQIYYKYIIFIIKGNEYSKVFTVVVKSIYLDGPDLGLTWQKAAVGVPRESGSDCIRKEKMTEINTDTNNSRGMNKCVVTDLQVLLQPVILPEEKLLAKLQVKVDLSG